MWGPASQEDDIAHAVWSWLLLLLLLLELLRMPWQLLLLLLLPDGLLCIGSLWGALDTAHASLLWVSKRNLNTRFSYLRSQVGVNATCSTGTRHNMRMRFISRT